MTPRTLSSYAEVSEALSNPVLSTHATGAGGDAELVVATIDPHKAIRAAARELFPASRLRGWRESLSASAESFARALPTGVPVDLMEAFAAPWSLGLAVEVSGLTQAEATYANDLARRIFLRAAMTRHPMRDAGDAEDTALTLARALQQHATTSAIDVQSFVALAHTLPHLLVAVWHALFTHPQQIDVWRSAADRTNAVDELLRFAGPSHAVFRHDVAEPLTLLLAEANRDPSVFPDPGRLDLCRANARRHVALGSGLHPCVGGPIVRLATEVATDALLTRVGHRVVIDEIRWLDGFAIRAPSMLRVRIPSF